MFIKILKNNLLFINILIILIIIIMGLCISISRKEFVNEGMQNFKLANPKGICDDDGDKASDSVIEHSLNMLYNSVILKKHGDYSNLRINPYSLKQYVKKYCK